ncbi:MAG TPA: hypothetical protein PLZ83_14400, partial [Dermatophilaceae bacterium]|nr:hypothetical protein [Dermatophilaceae bacterium]
MLPLAAALLATACTGSPTPPGAGDPTTSAAPTGSAGIPGVSGMPPTELSVAGITVVQSMGNDPLLPV